jgi:cell division protein ZapA (FtsZ GTPase activity inhibitor)
LADKSSIPVTIQGRDYRIRGEGDAETVRRAAELLNATMDRVRDRSGTVDSMDVTVLAALNLAKSLLVEKDGRAPLLLLEDRVDELVALIEPVLVEGATAP